MPPLYSAFQLRGLRLVHHRPNPENSEGRLSLSLHLGAELVPFGLQYTRVPRQANPRGSSSEQGGGREGREVVWLALQRNQKPQAQDCSGRPAASPGRAAVQ
jgi:hypothetical protein